MIWVSKRAYRDVCSERDRLRVQNDGLVLELTSLARVANGLRETRKKAQEPIGPIPETLRTLIAGFESNASRREMEKQCILLKRKGKTWEQIEKILTDSL